jgi:cytoskeletal protein CcmA (bactofilin family)
MKTHKSTILRVCLLVAFTLMLPSSALARQVAYASTVQQGQVLDQNMILSGTAVTMDGVINGDLLAVGDTVTINGEVKGSLIVAAKNVVLNGPVSGSAYIAGLTLVLAPQANVQRDVYFVGNRIEMQDGSIVNRDLNVVSLEAALNGSVARDVNAQIGVVNLLQKAYQFAISRGWLPPNSQLLPSGFESAPAAGIISRQASLQNVAFVSHAVEGKFAANRAVNSHRDQSADTTDASRWKNWAITFLRSLAGLLILGLLALWLVPAQLSWAGEQAHTKPWQAFLTGLLVLVIGWFAAVIAGVLVLALAVFLYWVSLPNLAFLLGSLGLIALGLATVIFWLSIVYFSKIIVAALVGKLLFQRFMPKYAHSRVWPFVVGVFLYALLASVPYLGWVVAVITTLFGLGALWMTSQSGTLPRGKPAAEPQPVGGQLEIGTLTDG